MKYLWCLCFLPFLLASEMKHITCPNGHQCPFGKSCCIRPIGIFGCCDLPKQNLEEQRLDPAASTAFNWTKALHNDVETNCDGTECGYYCHKNIYEGVCCDMNMFACPKDTNCCANKDSGEHWCCPKGKDCSSTFEECERASCDGTECGIYCHEKVYDGVCCDNKRFSCPKGHKCCAISEEHYCCPNERRCGSRYDLCEPLKCNGTLCNDHCVEGLFDANCCINTINACPSDEQCCSGNKEDESWCCSRKQRCGDKMSECLNSASSTSIAVVSVLFAFLLGVTSKRFL